MPTHSNLNSSSDSKQNTAQAVVTNTPIIRNNFIQRHLGSNPSQQQQMLAELGFTALDELCEAVIPASIHVFEHTDLALDPPKNEVTAVETLRQIAAKNKIFHSLIGQGVYGTQTPYVILRNVFENPAWYTAYTPYQPEISQGRLEALLNFQQMVIDLTSLAIANASMLDEATAAAEAMLIAQKSSQSSSSVFYIAEDVLPQTIEVVQTRAQPLGIEVKVGPAEKAPEHECFGVLLQYPGVNGEIKHYAELIQTLHQHNALVIVAADLLALTMLTPPGEWGADCVVGTTQRFGIPMGFGGPHAAYLAVRDALKRVMPGRLVGVTIDSQQQPALRLTLQTREQHIRREKATSNICTAQALLAIGASLYAVYHGPKGLKQIAQQIHHLTKVLALGLAQMLVKLDNSTYFDTLSVHTGSDTHAIYQTAINYQINLRKINTQQLGISLDETCDEHTVCTLWKIFAQAMHFTKPLPQFPLLSAQALIYQAYPEILMRSSAYLTHPVFNRYHSEHEMLRYLRHLADKDLALDRTMIPLGSCTMKLNATAQMLPMTWPEWSDIHPLAPIEQTQGYQELIAQLEKMLAQCTGYAQVSLQPNAGSQGEYAGLLMIKAYHAARGEAQRTVCLIPASAHGTNPASAQMAGLKVMVISCDPHGNIDLDDLKNKAEQHQNDLAAMMITYPSTHGVFEEQIIAVCDLVHRYGGQVYIDGANMNAMLGLCFPGHFGGDVSHLNLHKTFAIPHGGGGPGVGPIAVAQHLVPFLPNHRSTGINTHTQGIGAISAFAYGSASILPISWMYLKLMGKYGLKQATQNAILNANYLKKKLGQHYPILYTGKTGWVAHECILDLRPIKINSEITVDDIAKRLIDYGFHAPTMSFPVPGTLMIEPTESESKAELDRFIAAMIAIREEIKTIENGQADRSDNLLKNAPHTASMLTQNTWTHPYSREQAAYPLKTLKENKYWPPVGRADNAYGDRNIFCACIPIEN